MALGRHWEWRGFGSVSDSLRERWNALEHALPDQQWHDMVDRYLWVPGYGMNAKMRSGPPIDDCLKFKRLRARWNQLQLWHEDPEDIHRFPLRWSDLRWLAQELHVDLPDKRQETVGFEEALEIFQHATPSVQIIEVHKHRQARLWQQGDTQVLVEIAELSRPEVITSLSLESTLELTEWAEPKIMTAARDSVKQAVEDLGVENENLHSMNYVDALTIWADGERLGNPV
jgi:hypothetical protein